MSETEGRFSVLRQSADAGAVAAIERLVREAPDRALSAASMYWISPRPIDLDEERSIAAFLHAARLGLFDLSWNVLCPGCGGVLDSNATLKTVDKEAYSCALCAAGYEPTSTKWSKWRSRSTRGCGGLPRTIPNTLPMWEYMRQMFWSSGIELPDDEAFEKLLQEIVIESVELPAGEKAHPVAAAPGAVHHRVRSGDARGAFY